MGDIIHPGSISNDIIQSKTMVQNETIGFIFNLLYLNKFIAKFSVVSESRERA